MEFSKVKTEIRSVELDSVRAENDSYMEVVVTNEIAGTVTRILEKILGKPVWPSKEKMAKDVQGIADNFGGVRKGQTLFCLKQDGTVLFAMFWPWQDGKRTTIKMGQIKQ